MCNVERSYHNIESKYLSIIDDHSVTHLTIYNLQEGSAVLLNQYNYLDYLYMHTVLQILNKIQVVNTQTQIVLKDI